MNNVSSAPTQPLRDASNSRLLTCRASGALARTRAALARKSLQASALGSPALESHLAKYRKLVPALALVRHLADGGTGPVSVEALRSAIAWSRYLESHARRIYGSMGEADLRAARAIIARIKQGDLAEPFLARELIRKGWAGLTDAVIAKNALDLLEDAHWLSARSGRTGGRPLERYTINPKAKHAPEA